MNNNTTITINIELSSDTYDKIARLDNLNYFLKAAAERELYARILEELPPLRSKEI